MADTSKVEPTSPFHSSLERDSAPAARDLRSNESAPLFVSVAESNMATPNRAREVRVWSAPGSGLPNRCWRVHLWFQVCPSRCVVQRVRHDLHRQLLTDWSKWLDREVARPSVFRPSSSSLLMSSSVSDGNTWQPASIAISQNLPPLGVPTKTASP